jgi:hypothetical protein
VSTAGYLALLAQIDEMNVSAEAKLLFSALVEEKMLSEAPDVSVRVRLARNQLAAGVPRAEICRQLCARFAIGKSQAYRDIEAALNLSHTMGNS